MSLAIQNLQDPIAIIGMGLSGSSIQRLIKKVAPTKRVITFDSKPGIAEVSDLKELFQKHAVKSMVVSPGIHLKTPEIQEAIKKGVFLTSELSLAYSCLGGEKIIAVTGSVGKSTCTALLEKAMQAIDRHSLAAGNIGKPLAEYVLELQENQRQKAAWIALELSSYQLENFEPLKAEHSLLTFFTPNHMERYSSLDEYYETKWSLVNKTKGFVFLNSDSVDLKNWAQSKPLNEKISFCSPRDKDLDRLNLNSAALLGAHNQQNLALVGKVILCLGWGDKATDAIKKFPGLKHRLENLGNKKGIRFVNDSKATALDSVWSAVESLADQVQSSSYLWLLIGGRDKNLPWSWLSRLKNISNIKTIYFGECRKVAEAGIGLAGPQFEKFEPAVQHILAQAKAGDTVLLSPGGTSHDEFKGFEARGDFFRELVQKWN